MLCVLEDNRVVCPSNLRNNLFTVGALDNTDHNLTSTTAQGSFHGTAISVFQFPTVMGSAEIGLLSHQREIYLSIPYQIAIPMCQLSPVKLIS